MMRALIFVSLAGAAAYVLIPASEEREWNAGEKVSTASRLSLFPKAIGSCVPGVRPSNLWAVTAKAGRPQQLSLATLKQEALYQPDIARKLKTAQPTADTGAQPRGGGRSARRSVPRGGAMSPGRR